MYNTLQKTITGLNLEHKLYFDLNINFQFESQQTIIDPSVLQTQINDILDAYTFITITDIAHILHEFYIIDYPILYNAIKSIMNKPEQNNNDNQDIFSIDLANEFEMSQSTVKVRIQYLHFTCQCIYRLIRYRKRVDYNSIKYFILENYTGNRRIINKHIQSAVKILIKFHCIIKYEDMYYFNDILLYINRFPDSMSASQYLFSEKRQTIIEIFLLQQIWHFLFHFFIFYLFFVFWKQTLKIRNCHTIFSFSSNHFPPC